MKSTLPLWLIAPVFITGCATQTGSSARHAPGSVMHVRTTAYTHTEAGGNHNGCDGKKLSSGKIHSAASDWSWIPVGTKFQIVQTGEICIIEDYGSALVGRQTIDLYKPSRKAMRAWGVRFVDIKILEWGSPRRSLEILSPRCRKNAHVQKMVITLRAQTEGIPKKFHKLDS